MASGTSGITCKVVDYADARQGEELLELLNAYSMDRMANEAPLSDSVKSTLIAGLTKTPGAFSIIAYLPATDDTYTPVGLANCFMGFSTFAAKPLINIHDLVVLPGYRGKGIGQVLLHAIEQIANERGCCKLVLEVRTDNPAERLYRREGFTAGDHPYIFLSKALSS
jgi:ribosomal protein S18 acetylase RimI-like enzyme